MNKIHLNTFYFVKSQPVGVSGQSKEKKQLEGTDKKIGQIGSLTAHEKKQHSTKAGDTCRKVERGRQKPGSNFPLKCHDNSRSSHTFATQTFKIQ